MEKLFFIMAAAAVTAAVAAGAGTASAIGAADTLSPAFLGSVNIESCAANDEQQHGDENVINRSHNLTSFR